VGSAMDDVQAFIHMKMEEISDFKSETHPDIMLEKIMSTWNDKIVSRYAQKLNRMNVNEK
jgi:hypothetical protein